MDEEGAKICQNCKREIPAENFTIHTVHCARNIRICPVCKEPVPQSDLRAHHETLHKLLPCKQCGEKVCGTDLEDHIRDSCANTVKSCRFCELELARRELPAHEAYCGVRTEQCADCREWVMLKYRQLHLDSNHGFIRLDDDPKPKNEVKPLNCGRVVPRPNMPSTSTGNGLRVGVININNSEPKTPFVGGSIITIPKMDESMFAGARKTNGLVNGVKPPLKRTNDQPQINTNVNAGEKVTKDVISRGAVKKKAAPQPPVAGALGAPVSRGPQPPRATQAPAARGPPVPPARAPPPPDAKRDQPYYSALKRQQKEERERQLENAYNASVGLPPVLNPAQKIEKLRKMDALHNREAEEPQARAWRPTVTDNGHVLDNSEEEIARRRQEFKNLKPMSPEEFMERFNELQLRRDGEGQGARGGDREGARGDRFSEIKSSLRELRRGLNEVTAPYNANAALNNVVPGRGMPHNGDHEEVRLPCEFCGDAVPAQDLVQHQTGCRPDLAQFRPRSSSPTAARGRPEYPEYPGHREYPEYPGHREYPEYPGHREYPEYPGHREYPVAPGVPVIPCEFCAESLPVYLISEHQERCGREANLLYPD